MIQIKKVSKSYGKVKIVSNLTLSIKKGTVFGFLGPNGAGKTTTIKMLVGLSIPDAGQILIENNNPATPETREKIGFMPEDPYFYNRLTGLEFLLFCNDLFSQSSSRRRGSSKRLVDSRILGNDKQARFGRKRNLDDILKMVGLLESKDKLIINYSKGMKQRLGLAQAFVNDPDYIFLDEPLDGMDPVGRREVKAIIIDLKKAGKTIFFNSHILSDIEEICDQIGIINHGKLVYSGTVKSFTRGKSLEEAFVRIVEHNAH